MTARQVPVIAVNGFLESGKTFFFNDAWREELFIDSAARCVLLCCEEGNTEYDPRLLKTNHISVVTVPSPDVLTEAFYSDVIKQYHPDLIYMEQNAMWDMAAYRLPRNVYLAQQITVVNTATFQIYFNNMRQRVVDMLAASEVVIMYNCDDEKATTVLKRNLQLINPKMGYLLFDSTGNTVSLADDLPYKVDGNYINVADTDVGVFFVDSIENPDRYNGKTVELTVHAVLDKTIPEGFFVGGRRVMTCCANDVAFYFVLCHNATSVKVNNGDWLRVAGEVAFHEMEGERQILMDISSVTKLPSRPDDETLGLG